MRNFARCVKMRKRLLSMLYGAVRRRKMCGVVAQLFFKRCALGEKDWWLFFSTLHAYCD
jgi:hypothetical protein